MRISLLSITAAALVLAGCSAEVDEAPPEPEQPAFEVLPEIAVEGPERRILAFGDSLFAGYGLEELHGYPEQLERTLRHGGINARVIDAGVSGDTSAAGRQRLAFTLDGQDKAPELVLLELGGNDLLRGIQPEQTRENLEAMLGELKARGIAVLLMGMRAPPNYGPEFQAQFDAMYADLAREYDVSLVPFWLETIYEDQSLFLPDRIHPTAEGIKALVADTEDDVRGALPEG